MGIFYCFIYFLFCGALSFLLGRAFSGMEINFSAFPFRSFPFEKEGRIYQKLKIRKWQAKVPDMSRIFGKIMPEKKLDSKPDEERILVMIRETCIAEAVHFLLILSGAGYLFIWKGAGGIFCFLLNLFGNLVFIIIQRYNRPRFVKILEKYRKEEKRQCVL